jgi:spore coat protein A, manganese oxidase
MFKRTYCAPVLVLVACLAACGVPVAPSTSTGRDSLASARSPRGPLDPTTIPQFETPLVVPPEMPKSTSDTTVDYQIAVRQFRQQILPPGFPSTTVWGYGSIDHPTTFNYPSFTIEAQVDTPTRVKWINDLKDSAGKFLPHLLPVDQTLHWANPPQQCADGMMQPDCRGLNPSTYRGPVPMVVHLHGAHATPDSDGAPQAWWLPDARNLPPTYATHGSEFSQSGGGAAVPGQAIFRYPNDQRATTLWYHDHTLGMTRVNVYAGPAGFYLLRGGAGLQPTVKISGEAAKLPGPPPGVGADALDAAHAFHEVPLAIQDRSFYSDGALFYPDSRKFFDGFTGPFFPASDIAPIFNPETFGNTIVVNGRTWPYLEVEQRRYRFRLLNGSQARFLLLEGAPVEGSPQLTFWQIGAEGGFLPEPVQQTRLLMAPAERADVIVDFKDFPVGTRIKLLNLGPDEPFGGGEPGVDFAPANPETTGKVMEFRVVAATSADDTTPPDQLALPAPVALGTETNTRRLSLNESDSSKVCLTTQGKSVPCGSVAAVAPFGPEAARLGTVDGQGMPRPAAFMDEITENPALGATEIWELYNFTADAHPIHIHLVQFEVVNREKLQTDEEGMSVSPVALTGETRNPEPWERGRKDTVIVYPGEMARVKARFDVPGKFMWHCHIVEHEDNEMMRPYFVGP